MKHKIYLISNNSKGRVTYDSYDAHVVIADTEYEARNMCLIGAQDKDMFINKSKSDVKIIGESDLEKGVILSSFNAG